MVYLEVMDAVADSKDTIMEMLHKLCERFIQKQNRKWLVVEGDAKVYEILKSLKFEYGEELNWVIPYPGDWHMQKKIQIPIMKAYFDAGLKSLAKAAGYPTAQIQSCGQFTQHTTSSWKPGRQCIVQCCKRSSNHKAVHVHQLTKTFCPKSYNMLSHYHKKTS